MTAFRGPAAWTGYDLVSGHWYTGPDQVLGPDRLPHPDRHVGRRHDRDRPRDATRLRVRIVGEVFDTHNRGVNIVTNWATLRTIDPGLAPDQFDVGLRPGTSASAYANAVSRTLGPNYPVELNARGPAVVDAMIGLIATLAALLAAVAALGVLNTVVLEHARARPRPRRLQGGRDDPPPDDRDGHLVGRRHRSRRRRSSPSRSGSRSITRSSRRWPEASGCACRRASSNVYGAPKLVVLAFAGVLIAVIGALAPATWAARIHTATALHTE